MGVLFNVSAMTVAALSRKCPKCGREQAVPPSLKSRSVACKFCGAPVPPKRT